MLIPLQIVPDDNSCLFSSIALIFEQTISKAQDIRKSESLALAPRPFIAHTRVLQLSPTRFAETQSSGAKPSSGELSPYHVRRSLDTCVPQAKHATTT